MSSRKLLDHLKSVANKSGAIPSAPQGLMDMKRAIESIPMSVQVPGMSQLIQAENLVVGVVDLIKSLGSLSAVGEFKNVLGRLVTELGEPDITKVDPERLAQAIRKSIPLQELEQIVGQATSLTASLSGAVRRLTNQ